MPAAEARLAQRRERRDLTLPFVTRQRASWVRAVVALLFFIGAVRPGVAAPATVSSTVHLVKPGETLWSIGQLHGLTPEAIGRANEVSSLATLQIGQRLVIRTGWPAPAARPAPSPAGRHVVQPGDTLWSISKRHGLSVDSLVALNRLPSADRLQLGQALLLPRSAGISPGLAWPSRGVITSRFGLRGRRHHHGVDIAAPVGTPIGAAQDGVVQYTGWRGGYGLLVILDNGGGLTTWYGHASRILVRVGDRVRKGQLVARVGTTGNVTGPNVHFEVRKSNVPLDPLKFLRLNTTLTPP
ncbi:MAG TPA: peptidoglycan DD-metalloendopeptidase family protein [bacterium]|nr:peptidoglycan DD-metalloendopeptidase family protein [bacterium]